MIYYLLYPLHTYESLSFLNVLRYVPFRFLMATITSLLLAFGLYPWFIRRLQRKQIGQVIRADGPETHFSKAVFLGSHNAVVLSILKGEVDGGAAFEDIRAVVAKSFPEIYKKIKVIAHTEEIPNDTVAARKDLSPEIKEKIREGLKAMAKSKEGMDILRKSYQIGGLMDLDGYYDSVRKAGTLLGLDLGKLSR
jgi:ABC-type phosphate/phosphonate transport system substrate-binding protein